MKLGVYVKKIRILVRHSCKVKTLCTCIVICGFTPITNEYIKIE